MEYCEEGDLFNYYKSKNKELSVEEIIRIFRQITQAFIVMNVKGVLHRDLKPENILIFENGYVKLTDFGLAKELRPDELSKTEAGTSFYYAPEMVLRVGYYKYIDLWAIGIFAY